MARINRDANGDVIEQQPVAAVAAEPAARVFEVMVDALGADAIKGDLVTQDDVTWDFPYLLATHAIRPAAEYERAYDEEGLRSTTQPKEGQPVQPTPVLLQNAPQTQAPPAPATPVEPAPVVAPVVEPS